MNHELKVPIINNPLDQTSLFKVLEKAFEANPQTNAVLIKGTKTNKKINSIKTMFRKWSVCLW